MAVLEHLSEKFSLGRTCIHVCLRMCSWHTGIKSFGTYLFGEGLLVSKAWFKHPKPLGFGHFGGGAVGRFYWLTHSLYPPPLHLPESPSESECCIHTYIYLK